MKNKDTSPFPPGRGSRPSGRTVRGPGHRSRGSGDAPVLAEGAAGGRDKALLQRRGRLLSSLIWRNGAMSRWELHQATGLHPNLVGSAVHWLLAMHVLREGSALAPGGSSGRPRIPLMIDPTSHVLGVAIRPGSVEVATVYLDGRLNQSHAHSVHSPGRLISVATEAVRRHGDHAGGLPLAIGMSATGFVDVQGHTLVLSSAAVHRQDLSLQPIYDAAGDLPLVLDNDMHALGARWLLSRLGSGTPAEDPALLVGLNDGSVGASLLVDGHPLAGCLGGGHEIGHTRLNVATDPCYCGGVGCLERIFSTGQLRRMKLNGPDLSQRLMNLSEPVPQAISQIMGHLATSLANAVHFAKPATLVIAGPFAESDAFRQMLTSLLRDQLMLPLARRVTIQFWPQSSVQSAESAAWLALYRLFGSPGEE